MEAIDKNCAKAVWLGPLIEFYEALGYSSFPFASYGTGASVGFDSYLITSIRSTLQSIDLVLDLGRVGDAYSLLRRYHDLMVTVAYVDLYLDHHSKDGCLVVDQINKWMRGGKPLPRFDAMVKYITRSPEAQLIAAGMVQERRYSEIRKRCNGHLHCNSYSLAVLNDSEVNWASRERVVHQFQKDLIDLFVLHFAFIVMTRDYYLGSSDYVDCLDCGLTPEPESQYWVAPYAQEIFDSVIKVNRPDIVAALITGTSMQLS